MAETDKISEKTKPIKAQHDKTKTQMKWKTITRV